MTYAIILAGGKGTRMGKQEMPKQFLHVGKIPIVIHTVKQFINNKNIDKTVICCPSEWIEYTKNLLSEYHLDNENLFVTEGGSDRNSSIMNGCKFIKQNFGITKKDKVITHDAVRPFVTKRIIDDNVKGLDIYRAVDTCISATDTIVEGNESRIITNIPDRKKMYQGQTPQSFYIKELMSVYNKLTKAEKNILTDACKIYVLKDIEVGIVEGEPFNMKITTPTDIIFANAIYEQNSKE